MLIHSSLQKQAKIVFTLVVTVQSTAQRNVFGQLLLLWQEHGISFQKVAFYPMYPAPWAHMYYCRWLPSKVFPLQH